MTTLYQYQEIALRTAQDRALSFEYLIPGIIEEIGELFGQTAKAHWHGWPEAQLKAELISEYGDIAWKTAVLLHWQGVHSIDDRQEMTTLATSNDDPWGDLLQAGQDLYEEHRHHELTTLATSQCLTNSAQRLWFTLFMHCQAVTGETFDFVLAFNESKLRDRETRGVLQGKGDHR